MSNYFISMLSPLVLLMVGAFGLFNREVRPKWLPHVSEASALVAIFVSIAVILILARQGAGTSDLVGVRGIGFSIRMDALSASMMLLVSFIGWIVLRYTRNYLDGEARQGSFIAWLCITLSSVLLLVMAGNLVQFFFAWVATSLSLHQLLLFYPERIGARRAARKKFVTARVGDAALLGAFVLLAMAYSTLNVETILASAQTGRGGKLVAAAASLLAVAAMLKSAQFPTHGWLIEVMETPTPVSALLHAGVINAGGFLLIRFADVLLLAPGALAALVMIGGFTALLGGLVMLTQPAVKTSLAWSTVSQMGFMILECGLALFPLALLHIVAHSLYKAHSFLASGGAVERVAAIKRPGSVAVPNSRAVARAFLVALAIYGATALTFNVLHETPQAIALGAILVFGVAYLLAQGFADAAPMALTWRTVLYAAATSFGYFALRNLAIWLTRDTFPAAPIPGPLEWALIVLAVLSFGLVALVQSMFPLWAYHPAAAGLRVHLSNGLYANAAFDRLIGGWSMHTVTKNSVQ